MFFYEGMTTSVDKGRAMSVVYLDFCKAFDRVMRFYRFYRFELEGTFKGHLVQFP